VVGQRVSWRVVGSSATSRSVTISSTFTPTP
jgi:hypothetical protein